ncbi:hypothetical protein BU26DRAFT_508584 [Trematosphaeria pertusa]|uniref:Uncharacterized protein n=1 Tax=Trematosphaeria pertusa TaxID=390896 RepID=A0A6A6I2J5_9PLEO|nr:uncharacterized protein BU26DRAFT_508584 [Trematosphaeria pertusa]KAF2244561.1 hypothetical protein BU26DRAFT_508584 [Trematosphaeria pertusa]
MSGSAAPSHGSAALNSGPGGLVAMPGLRSAQRAARALPQAPRSTLHDRGQASRGIFGLARSYGSCLGFDDAVSRRQRDATLSPKPGGHARGMLGDEHSSTCTERTPTALSDSLIDLCCPRPCPDSQRRRGLSAVSPLRPGQETESQLHSPRRWDAAG